MSYRRYLPLLFWCCWLLALGGPARAQYEFNAWRFGLQTGLNFPAVPGSGPPQSVTSSLFAIEGCAAIADSAGNLLLYTNAEHVYDRRDQLLPGGQLAVGANLSGSNAVQGSLLLRHPGPPRRYLLFKVDEAQRQFADGLRYTDILMAPDGHSGQVLMPQPRRLTPVGYRVTEAMTAVRHANGGDYWVVVHQYEGREFLSYHITAAGPDTVPVRSAVGSYHGYTNPGVAMRASPDGARLAASVPGGSVELFDFDNQTGRLSNARPVPGSQASYGLEFSPDSKLLYLSGNAVSQADLTSGAAPVQLAPPVNPFASGAYGTLQRGPDGRIYVAIYQANYLAAITSPNTAGPDCHFVANAVALPSWSLYGLPNYPNQPSRPLRLSGASQGCAGQDIAFSATGLLVDSAAPSWDFGDPAAGAANQATGAVVRHRYQQPGTYLVTLTVASAGGPVQRTQQVRVQPRPTLHLLASRPDTTLCAGEALTLRASPQPAGTTFRWQDGSADSTLVVQQPGFYTLEVRSATGCTSRASALVASRDCTRLPNIITPNGDGHNQTFVLAGLQAADWSIRIFNRWGTQVRYQEQYDDSWAAPGQAAGVYYYLLENRQTGARRQGWVEVVK